MLTSMTCPRPHPIGEAPTLRSSVEDAALQRVASMLLTAGTADAVLPPTALYNEGWMLRLVLHHFSRDSELGHPLAFAAAAQWRSEVLLPSQFKARVRGDPLAEAWTHADGVLGHLARKGGRGDVRLSETARQFVVVEAKMFSGLSAGTTRAPTFNQAARNVACIAEVLHLAGRSATELDDLGFVLLAPREKIDAGVFGSLCDKSQITSAVRSRVDTYGGAKEEWFNRHFLPTLSALRIDVLSWEDQITSIATRNADAAASLQAFYDRCLTFNRRGGTAFPSD